MLNGKFFTGLPPKMMDRVGAGKNRQESQLFWPDESQSVSATDSSQKRKSSLQNQQQQEKPIVQRQSSIGQHNVDTKGMFQKEFAKSSIQFYDNIEEQPEPSRTTLLRGKLARKEIAPKPTATRLELPKSVIDEEYTNAKKQQTYASKIEFYDYADEGPLNNRPRMDMNDKRAVERNTKNSPKLQNKHNVKNLRADPVVPAPQLKFRNDYGRDAKTPVSDKNTRKIQSNEQEYVRDEVNYESDLKPRPIRQEDQLNNNKSRVEQVRVEQFEQIESDPYVHSRHTGPADLHYIENNMRNVRIQPTPRKHVTYQEDYESVGFNEQYYEEPSNSRVKMPNQINAGNYPRPQPQSSQRRSNESNYGTAETQYMENRQRSARSTFNHYNNVMHKPNNNNNSNHNIYNNSHNNNIQSQRKLLPKMSTQTPTAFTPTMDSMEPPLESTNTSDSQQHLRSDTLFMESPSTQSPTAATMHPTQNYRRNARSSTQRVSVGLPD